MSQLELHWPGTIHDWPVRNPAYIPNARLAFWGTDSAELFLKNSKTMPADWMYHNTSIEYKFNSHGFRQTKELLEINQDNYIYSTGGCFAGGVGVREEDRHSDIVAKELKMDLLTWSTPLGGIKIQVINFMSMLKIAPVLPKIVILNHAQYNTYSHYSNGEFLLYQEDNLIADKENYPIHATAYQELIKSDFFYNECMLYQNIMITTCKRLGIKYIETSYYHADKFVVDQGIPSVDRTAHVDDINYAFARDYRPAAKLNPYIAHMGVGVHKEMSELILGLV
jgi:hypothetical protein